MDPEKCCESGCTPCERDPVGSEPRDLCNYIDGEFICHSNDDWMNVLNQQLVNDLEEFHFRHKRMLIKRFLRQKSSASMG